MGILYEEANFERCLVRGLVLRSRGAGRRYESKPDNAHHSSLLRATPLRASLLCATKNHRYYVQRSTYTHYRRHKTAKRVGVGAIGGAAIGALAGGGKGALMGGTSCLPEWMYLPTSC